MVRKQIHVMRTLMLGGTVDIRVRELGQDRDR
jgi:hypothetical protein